MRTRALLAAWMLLAGAGFRGDSASDIVERLQHKYDSLRDVSVTFTQHVVFGVTKAEQTFSGTFAMKKGNKYRIDMDQQTIVSDGRTLWSYVKANRQVVIDCYTDDPKSFSPDRLFVNIPKNYSATVLGQEEIDRRPATMVKLIPNDKQSNLLWLKIWVDTGEWLMRKIQLLDSGENLTTYSISAIRWNAGVPDSLFRFTAPDSVDVVDLR